LKYDGTFIVWGPPGTGKTTFLSAQVKKILNETSRPPLVCSLTKTAATEIAGRVNLPRDYVGTLHSHAFKALGRPDIAETMVDDWNEINPRLKIDTKDRHDADEPGYEFEAQSPGNDLLQEYHLYRARQVPRKLWRDSIQSFAVQWEYWKNEVGVMDFTDMIEQAAELDPPENVDIIIADEVQDHSALEYNLLKRWGTGGGKTLIVSGDPWQALYTWRGAHPELFLDPNIGEDRRRVLSQSYRIPGAVHRTAMTWARRLSCFTSIDYAPRKDDSGEEVPGSVRRKSVTWKSPEPLVPFIEKELSEGRSVMVLGSCSFLLGPTVAVLKKAAVPFANPWRVRRGDWNPLTGSGVQMKDRLVDFLSIDPGSGEHFQRSTWTFGEFSRIIEPMKAKGNLCHGIKSYVENYPRPNDDVEELEYYIEEDALLELQEAIANRRGPDPGPIGELIEWWNCRLLAAKKKAARFPIEVVKRRGVSALSEDPKCFVGTIHSFKGAEADTVIMFSDLSPSGWRTWNGTKGTRDEVVRMFYVGITRAKENLIICEPGSMRQAPVSEAIRN